jgi:4-hydroxy-tetrahydrodipicolinate synthase
MFNPTTLHGIIPPMCTPLNDAGEVDLPSVHTLVEHLIAGGVHAIFALGSSGENASLTAAQRQALLTTTIVAVKGRVPVLAGIIDTSTARCIEQGLAARETGADALVLAPTYYYRAGQAELIDHFRAVRAAVGLPIMAYDVPGAVNVKLEYATVVQLAEEGVIDGLKDSSGVTEGFRRVLIGTRGSSFRAFTGSELIVDSCLQMGAHGSVPGLANIFPAEYVRIYDLAQAGDWSGAAALQERLLTCFYELIGQGDPGHSVSSSALGGFKTGLKIRGAMRTTRVTAPLHSFGPAEEERVADVMRRHGFLNS